MQLRLLGPPAVRVGSEQSWQPLRPSNHAGLLCYLAYRGGWVSREEVALLFYPESSTKAARTAFRQLLRRAKGLPGGAQLEAENEQLRLNVDSDVQAFRAALGQGDWRAATELYEGPLLTGFYLKNAAGFEHWLDLERSALQSAWREAAVKHAEALATGEQFDPAAALLQEVVQHDLLAEDVVQQLMRYHYTAGGREEALRVYEAFKKELANELELDPLEETEALAGLIAQAKPLERQTAKETRTKVPLSVQRPPQLIGRTEAVDTLLKSMRPVALVAGEPGVGKTRLVTEVAPDALHLRCLEGLENVPYFPLVTHLRENLASLPELGSYLDELARLVPDAAPERRPAPADPVSGKSLMLEAWARYLAAYNPGGAYALILDDIQWADASTLELLTYLAGQGSLRIIACYRSSEVDAELEKVLGGLRSGKLATSVELEPLTQEAVTDLIASLSAQSKGPPLFSSWLRERTGGNPFFMLETLKALFESGMMEAGEDAWQSQVDDITQDYSELEVPPAVTEVVQKRVRSLSEETQRVLPVAAVIREGFTPELLSKLTGLSLWSVAEVLEEAEQSGIVTGAAFSHDLLRESLYGTLGETRRKFLHAQAAQVLTGERSATVIAEHWVAAGDTERAAALQLGTVEKLFNQGLAEEALDLARRALSLTKDPELILSIEAELAFIHALMGELELAQPLVDKVLATTASPATKGRALRGAAEIAQTRGKVSEVRSLLEEARGLVDKDGEHGAEIELSYISCLIQLGEFQKAEVILGPFMKGRDARAPDLSYLYGLNCSAKLEEGRGEQEKAVAVYRQIITQAKALGALDVRRSATNNLLVCLRVLERDEEAIDLAEEVLALNPPTSEILRYNLATSYLRLGRLEEARHLYSNLVESQTIGQRALTFAWSGLARVQHRCGELAAASASLHRALDVLENVDTHHARARLLTITLEIGEKEHRNRLEPFLRTLKREALEPDTRDRLAEALADYPDLMP